jgi:hypothetical protein
MYDHSIDRKKASDSDSDSLFTRLVKLQKKRDYSEASVNSVPLADIKLRCVAQHLGHCTYTELSCVRNSEKLCSIISFGRSCGVRISERRKTHVCTRSSAQRSQHCPLSSHDNIPAILWHLNPPRPGKATLWRVTSFSLCRGNSEIVLRTC